MLDMAHRWGLSSNTHWAVLPCRQTHLDLVCLTHFRWEAIHGIHAMRPMWASGGQYCFLARVCMVLAVCVISL